MKKWVATRWLATHFSLYEYSVGDSTNNEVTTYPNIQKNYVNFIDFSEKMYIIEFRMDTQIEVLIGDAESLAGHRVIVGAKQLRKALSAGTVRQAYFARNADPAITEPLAAKCRESNVAFSWVKSMTDLGHACGIEIGAAAAAIVNA